MVYSVVWNPCWLWWLLLLCIFKSTPRSGFSIILLCGMQTAWALHWEAPSHMSDSLTPVSLWKRPAWYYFWTCMEQNLVFKLQLGLLLSNCSLECGVYFIKCCDFFIEGKGSQMFFDESAATVFCLWNYAESIRPAQISAWWTPYKLLLSQFWSLVSFAFEMSRV